MFRVGGSELLAADQWRPHSALLGQHRSRTSNFVNAGGVFQPLSRARAIKLRICT